MGSSCKEDFGNLGNLVVYLNGSESLDERIRKARNIFFVSLDVPPQHKEEVIIVWLIDILSTSKVLTLSTEEVILVWKSLKECLSSKRIKSLSSQHWVCPLTTAFIQTLISAVCGSDVDAPTEIRSEAIHICDSLFRLPSLSPQISLLSKQSLKLFSSFLKLTCEGYNSPFLFPQLSLLLQKSSYILIFETNKHNTQCFIYEKLCLPLLEILYIFKDNRSEEYIELATEIEKFFLSTIFNKHEPLYFNVLEMPLLKDRKDELSKFGDCFYSFFTSLIEFKDKVKASDILREYFFAFFQVFKTEELIPFQIVINVMNILGIALDGGPTVQKDNATARALLPVQLSKYNQDRFIASILHALMATKVNLDLTLSDMTLKKWLENLGEFLITRGDINGKALSCMKILIQLDPLPTSKYSKLLFHILIADRTNMEVADLADEVLCEILNVHVKLRTVDLLYEDLCETLLTLYEKQSSISLSWQQSLSYKKSELLPCKFYFKLLEAISEMGTQMWMKLWDSVHKVVSQSCRKHLEENVSSESVACTAFTIWFSSCCLSAASVVEAVSVSGMASKISSMINSLVDECIKPLLNTLNELSEKNALLCSSLLNLILVWSELHSILLSISTEYKTQTNFNCGLENICEGPKDFSAIVPFINKNSWKDIFSHLSDEEDAHRCLIIQLMIQKFSLLKIQQTEIQIHQSIKKDSSIINILNYIFEEKDPSEFPLSLDIIAYHLPSLMLKMKKNHYNVVSKWFIFCLEEERESWIKFGKSQSFKESEYLQSSCFSFLCEKLVTLLSRRKRKLDKEDESVQPHQLTSNLLKKLIELQGNIGNFTDIEKDFGPVLADVETLFVSSNESSQLKKEKQIINILKFLDMFPVAFLRPKLFLCVITFVIIVIHEENELGRRKDITIRLVRLLNKIAYSPNCTFFFKLSKRKSYSILLWLQKQCDDVLKDTEVDGRHLNVILGVGNHQLVTDDILQELLRAMYQLTKAFVLWNDNGGSMNNYLEEIVASHSKEESKDANYLASLFLVRILQEESLPNYKLSNQMKTKELLITWCLEAVESFTLSKVTKVPMSWALFIFSFILNSTKHKNTKQDMYEQSKTETKHELKKDEIENVVKCGIRLAEVAVDTEYLFLKLLGLDFYISVCSLPEELKNNDAWDVSLKIWPLIFQVEDSNNHLKDFISVLSKEQYKTVFKVLIDEIKYKNVELPNLFRLLSLFITGTNPSQMPYKTISVLMEQLIGNLSIRFSNSSSYDEAHLQSLYALFISILQSQSRISNHSRSLILGMISHCSFTQLPDAKYFATFQLSTRLLSLLLLSEHPFISHRPSCFMAALTNLILSLLDKTDIEKGTFIQLKVKEIEKCCAELENLVNKLKHYDRAFSKILAFSIATILEKMQHTKMIPTLKLSMERIVCGLLDFSDPYSLRHLLVTLSPSLITVLKSLHSTFNSIYKFNPRTA